MKIAVHISKDKAARNERRIIETYLKKLPMKLITRRALMMLRLSQ